MPATNPLLQAYVLPPYSAVRAEHLVPAIEAIIADNRRVIAEIIASQSDLPTWDDLVLAMDELSARLDEAMGVINTLGLVAHEGNAWSEASSTCYEAAALFKAELQHNHLLFQAYQRLANSPQAVNFDASRKAVLNKVLRDFRLSGITLPLDQQQTLARLNHEISALGNLFLAQLESADRAWSKHVEDEADLAGLPETIKQRMAVKALEAGHEGWLITLDQDTYRQVMTYAEDRALREELFIAYVTRASDQGPYAGQFDNTPVLELLLADRHEKARVLGYSNFMELSLATNMADSPEQVASFLRRQLAVEKPRFSREAQELKAFAGEHGIADLQAWDLDFFAQKLRQERHGVSQEQFRAYFPLEGTLRRLALFAERLFGIEIVEQKDFSRWHDRVRLFQIKEHAEVIGHIYIDPYQRQEAKDFAWTATARNRRITAEGRVKLPIAILYGNFVEGVAGQPCLLDHRQLRTLFHEFGHCLQQVLTVTPYWPLSGITELGRDAAEFAGQVFERWCLSREFLIWLAAHHQTAERLSEAEVDLLLASTATQTSWETAHLLMGALFDFELHRSHGDGRSVQSVFESVQSEIAHVQFPAYARFANGFDYMVTGYGASVYAYIWSDVLATEAFKKFQKDWVFNADTGKALREAIFAPGDSRLLFESLEKFLGQPLAADLFSRETVLSETSRS
ncbi:M3 family metallopeptidase [Pseudomonas fluorescens]|uniref:oligopeptidase A n=1 Tax=Pseudomonas fluorescens TaxID=294 RepID=A0A5E7DB81_PSEFL|nr:M3 family metallopeptidase [Pseudomonas fluorescens]VVO14637.1 Oligopeptidase A [Pseudomonas fluorescens]